jgi:large subunit ribosomal protein L25
MANIKMHVLTRTDIGKNQIKKLRATHFVPGIIYCRGEANLPIAVDIHEIQKIFKKLGTASLIHLQLENQDIPVIIREIQRHPVSQHLLNIDFLKLHMDEKVRMDVPIIVHNKEAIKIKPSILSQALDQIEIECFPKDIPHGAEIDVIDIDFSKPLLVRDLDIATNKKITILRDLDDVVCSLLEPTKAEPEAVETEAAEEAPAAVKPAATV